MTSWTLACVVSRAVGGSGFVQTWRLKLALFEVGYDRGMLGSVETQMLTLGWATQDSSSDYLRLTEFGMAIVAEHRLLEGT